MDWTSLIKTLTDRGFTQMEIAEKCGKVTQSAISDLATGKTKSPSFNLGQALVNLAKQKAAA